MQHRIKRLRTMFPISRPDHLGEASKPTSDILRRAEPAFSGTVHRILRILLGDPWGDYDYIHSLGHDIVATRKASYFELVNIRLCHSSDVQKQYRLLSSTQSPNVATIYDLYSDGNKVFQVTERLDIYLSQLEVQKYELEEWEMATIIAEVLKGITYISSLKLSCRTLSEANIGLSLDGEVKLVLDLQQVQHDHLHEGSKVSQVLLDFPILAELIEDMMLSRYHLTPNDIMWSEDALSFLSCTLSGSLETLMK
ncbi:uncharacterized protein BP5553_06870 [Venustampulla echinocandica]|uniref:Protein kinase domain-containing protein n=1 Tax=Venustampulla echinocandica TaxID=2656787 RepID=A0A370TL59_9HELO|nr:uncharacterized protein BP5553_06870 [Venustampulla echinocandica]RDL36258.1 hypothetical protein BP5553_06870 [Venustampulla echinocandica]